jgi:catechol 2,3-dioxygenase-like lactoylglutathione lyase family enzyme
VRGAFLLCPLSVALAGAIATASAACRPATSAPVATAATATPGVADAGAPSRPAITGISAVRVFATNLAASRAFYGRVLGLRPSGPDGATFPVNERQRIELVATAGARPPANLVAGVVFATPDVARMRSYLAERGFSAGPMARDASGAPRVDFADPEGHPIAFVEVAAAPPAGPAFQAAPEQVSTRLLHAGFVVNDRAAIDRFYRDALAFRMYWYGGMTEKSTDWVEVQVPDGREWIEYMLNVSPDAGHDDLGVMNHLALGVETLAPAVQRIRAHGYKSDDQPEIGRDGKWQFDIFDPDGTRVEFMELTPAQAPCCHPYEAPHP